MSNPSFHDQISLAEQAEKLGKQAMKLGLIPSLTVHIFSDAWQFYVPNKEESELLTPEEAYLRFKKLVEESEASK